MTTIIRTEYINVNGTPKVRAKGGGKQRTVLWDLAKSTEWNHGAAAGALANVLFGTKSHEDATAMLRDAEHDSNDSGTRHGFAF